MKPISGYSEQFLRKRKMMLMVPLVFVPMLCLAFYGLDGGKGDADGPSAGGMKGLNMTLPLAHFDSRSQPKDKDGFYEKAKQDSMRLQERKKQDPYAAGRVDSAGMVRDSSDRRRMGMGGGAAPLNAADADRQADEALARLDQLKQLLGKKAPELIKDSGLAGLHSVGARMGEGRPDDAESKVAALLEKLKGGSASPGDPQMDRLDGMLDKLIRIQHPGQDHMDTTKVSVPPAAVVSVAGREKAVGSLGSDTDRDDGVGFIEIGASDAVDSVRELAIEAIINSDQTLTAGSTVALRIVQDFVLNGEHIAANQLVYGLAALAGERLTINITSIRVGQSIVPVSMQVYDLDGLPGIRVPGAITRDVSKESADQAISGLEMASVNPSLGAQAAGAGVEFAKSLASRKIRLVRVSLPAGYRVLLKNGKSNIH